MAAPGEQEPGTGGTIVIPNPLSIEYKEPLWLRVAMLLYSYGNFDKIDNMEAFAAICIKRGLAFNKAFSRIKTDGLDNFLKEEKQQ